MTSLDGIASFVGYVTGAAILLNVLDELFIDGNYFLRGLHRRAKRAISLDRLRSVEQKRIAILIPAWKEAEVIEQMLEHNLASLLYDTQRYDIFCGTYENDLETQQRVDAVARRRHNVHKVVVPHDGPTCKADCLNWVYQGVVLEEQRRGQRFDILLMHDAEDIVHPLSLRLYCLLLPEKDFVQTPVFSLPLSSRQVVAGTYIDEFSEHHLKDMPVREALGGLVPSAGVGSAFARDAFEEIALAHGQRAFNTDSLTEDYEIGLKFRLANKRVAFACYTVEAADGTEEYIATREYFPSGFRASIRQRSRWVLGITLQTWAQVGWRGSLPVLYCLWRDRKALFTNVILLLAYGLVAYVGARELVACVGGPSWQMERIAPPHSLLRYLLLFNLCMLLWRASVKASLVSRLYGLREGVLSVLRLIVGNVISISATGRAVSQYTRHRITKKPLRWLKTTHAFLSPDVLRAGWRRLGEFLMEQQVLDAPELERAVMLQKKAGVLLGEALVLSGALPPRRVTAAVARQHDLDVVDPDPEIIPLAALARIPESEAEELDILPISGDATGPITIAAAAPLSREVWLRLEQRVGAAVERRLAATPALQRARRRAYRRLCAASFATGQRPRRLGETLVERGLLDRPQLDAALDEQAETGEMLGELLVRKQLVRAQDLSRAMTAASPPFRALEGTEGDAAAIERVGAGFCDLYCLVPLALRDASGRRIVASSFALHERVKATVRARLGEPVAFELAPGLELRVALAIAARAPLAADTLALWDGVDRATARAIADELGGDIDVAAVIRGAHDAGVPEIDWLRDQRGLDAATAARIRSAALGIPLADGARVPLEGILPPQLVAAHGIELCEVAERALVMAAPRPTRWLAREVSVLLPDVLVAWQVAVS